MSQSEGLKFVVAVALGGTLLLSSTIAKVAMAAGAVGTTYCCIDAKSHRVCGDTLPESCSNRPYKAYGATGGVTQYEAPISAEERARRDAEWARQREISRQLTERERQDQALLSTYTNIQEIILAKERAVSILEAASADARFRLKQNTDLRHDLQEKLNKSVNSKEQDLITSQLANLDTEIKLSHQALDDKNKELEEIKGRYDRFQQRFSELTKRQ